jgi:seryl-tRNA(Sec) selenium transferase
MPIIARIENDQVLLDLRSLDCEDLEFVASQVRAKFPS